MESTTTPVWCIGAKNISITNDAILNVLYKKDINQKGINLGGSQKGTLSQNYIQGFEIGVITNWSPVTIDNDIFDNNTIDI